MSDDPGEPKRRMLPSVSDVVNQLKNESQAEPDVLFKVARQVCAEELNRVKQGFESKPLDVLVRRAQRLLEPSVSFVAAEPQPGLSVPTRVTPEPFAALSVPVEPSASPIPLSIVSDDPFMETTGALDLQWDRQREPLGPSEPQSHSAPDAAADPFLESPAESIPPRVIETVAEEGPGDETLNRLRHEADAVDLNSAIALTSDDFVMREAPPATDVRELVGSDQIDSPDAATQSGPQVHEPVFVEREGRSGMGALVGALIVVVVGFGGYKIYQKLSGPETLASPERPQTTEVQIPRAAPVRVVDVPTTSQPPTAIVPAAEPTVLIAVNPQVKSQVKPQVKPVATAVPVAPASTSSSPKTPSSVSSPDSSKPAILPASPESSQRTKEPVRQMRAASLVTPDWAGHEPVFTIHFSSYKDRPSAEHEAVKLARKLEQPARAVEVDLGEKGKWYRVVLGEFQTSEEAFRARAELEAKNTPNMGFVYRLTSAK